MQLKKKKIQRTVKIIEENLPVWEPRLLAVELPPPKKVKIKQKPEREKKNFSYFNT